MLHEALGWKNHAYRLPMERDSLFRMYSNTKALVATATLTLEEAGKLSTSDPVAKYFASFQNEKSRAITIFHLATHSSGFRIDRIFYPFDKDETPALRVEKLLLREPGVEVVLTRRTNVYVALEERTAIANRSAADLFLSIHVNASGNTSVRGFETYFLSFASNPEAEALAARENAGSSKTMGNLPDLLKAIALNNKLDESRDFAAMIQQSMNERLRKADRTARNLGMKQAPFMVLVGATMPSVLTEVSFLTNGDEATRLRTTAYRQQIAEALLTGITRYQQSLKAAPRVAAQLD